MSAKEDNVKKFFTLCSGDKVLSSFKNAVKSLETFGVAAWQGETYRKSNRVMQSRELRLMQEAPTTTQTTTAGLRVRPVSGGRVGEVGEAVCCGGMLPLNMVDSLLFLI